MLLIGLVVGLIATDAAAMFTLQRAVQRVPQGSRAFRSRPPKVDPVKLLRSSVKTMEEEKINMLKDRERSSRLFTQFSDSPHFSKQGQEIAERAVAQSIISQNRTLWKLNDYEAQVAAALKELEQESKEKDDKIKALEQRLLEVSDQSILKKDISKVKDDQKDDQIDWLIKENKRLRQNQTVTE